jgi:hypothetical protein
MILKSFISPLAIAAVLAVGSAVPASAAIFERIFSGGDVEVVDPQTSAALAGITPAQRTQLEDQCRQRQADDFNDDSDDDDDESSAPFRATPAYCAAIGLPA